MKSRVLYRLHTCVVEVQTPSGAWVHWGTWSDDAEGRAEAIKCAIELIKSGYPDPVEDSPNQICLVVYDGVAMTQRWHERVRFVPTKAKAN
jgi:hypothetical protein